MPPIKSTLYSRHPYPRIDFARLQVPKVDCCPEADDPPFVILSEGQ